MHGHKLLLLGRGNGRLVCAQAVEVVAREPVVAWIVMEKRVGVDDVRHVVSNRMFAGTIYRVEVRGNAGWGAGEGHFSVGQRYAGGEIEIGSGRPRRREVVVLPMFVVVVANQFVVAPVMALMVIIMQIGVVLDVLVVLFFLDTGLEGQTTLSSRLFSLQSPLVHDGIGAIFVSGLTHGTWLSTGTLPS